MQKKSKLALLACLAFIAALVIPAYSWTRQNVKKIETFHNSRLSPIIMIPGSSATENRFILD